MEQVADEEERERLLMTPTLDETAALPADLGQSGFGVVPVEEHAVAHPMKKSTSLRSHQD